MLLSLLMEHIIQRNISNAFWKP